MIKKLIFATLFIKFTFALSVAYAALPPIATSWLNAKSALCSKSTGDELFINFTNIKLVRDQWGSFDIDFGNICLGLKKPQDSDFTKKEYSSVLTGSYHLGSGYVLQIFEQDSTPVAFIKSRKGDNGVGSLSKNYDWSNPTNPINSGDMTCQFYVSEVVLCP